MAPEIMRYNGEEEYTEKVSSHPQAFMLLMILDYVYILINTFLAKYSQSEISQHTSYATESLSIGQ